MRKNDLRHVLLLSNDNAVCALAQQVLRESEYLRTGGVALEIAAVDERLGQRLSAASSLIVVDAQTPDVLTRMFDAGDFSPIVLLLDRSAQNSLEQIILRYPVYHYLWRNNLTVADLSSAIVLGLRQRQRAASAEDGLRATLNEKRQDSIGQMVTGLAHEVNTPLGVARSAAAALRELLAASHDTETSHEARDCLKLLERNLERAGELVCLFKDLSVEQISDELREVDLVDSIEDAVTLHRAQSRSEIELQIQLDNRLEADQRKWLGYPGYLLRVIHQLLENVARHAYPRDAVGRVDIVLAPCRDQPGVFQIDVRDYGVGVSEVELPRLFEAFFTTRRGEGGSGLGLAVIHNIVKDAFGGEVQCESTVGQGATFSIRFSHCRQLRCPIMTDLNETVELFEAFVELQQKLLLGVTLMPSELSELDKANAAVDRYLSTRFRGHERRAHPRVPCALPIGIRFGADPQRRGQAELRDISEGGGMLRCSEPREVGTDLGLLLPGKRPQLVTGRVVRSTAVDPPGSNRPSAWMVALQFKDLDGFGLARVKLLIAEVVLRLCRRDEAEAD